jgi:molybdate transport system regulatory protein
VKKSTELHLQFKLWISSAQQLGVFGDGKWRLLAAIQTCGSLRAAAAELGISYRKAWGDLKKAEERLGISFLKKTRGGSGGGESNLTVDGKKWIAAYSRLRLELERTAEKSFAKHFKNLLKAAKIKRKK